MTRDRRENDLFPLLVNGRWATVVSMFISTWRVVLLVAALSASAAAATPKPDPSNSAAPRPSATLSALAPADTYFGPFGMSPLSIRSTIGLLGREYHYRTISDHDLLRKALITEDALRRWRSKYPADPWLAPTFFHLEQLYQAVQTDEARKHATSMLKAVVAYYPNTKEGHLSRSRLAAGFPPLVAESPLVGSPTPSADPSASPDASSTAPAATGSAAPNAVSTPTPAATATPAPTGTATPTSTPAQRKPTR